MIIYAQSYFPSSIKGWKKLIREALRASYRDSGGPKPLKKRGDEMCLYSRKRMKKKNLKDLFWEVALRKLKRSDFNLLISLIHYEMTISEGISQLNS